MGHFVWVLLTVSVVRDVNGRTLYVINQIQDISERKGGARQLEYLVDHDFLTASTTGGGASGSWTGS